ncbi:MAG: hypothetical protein V4636_20155 [Pseudomonadota bacterium]
MSEEFTDMCGAMRDTRKLLRAKYGVPCPECVRKLPKAHPSILLPQQTCRIHRHKDTRPELTQADYDAAFAGDRT